MNKFIKIDGGYGRCIAATGPIKEYAKNSKDKVFVVTSFTEVFEGIDGIERVYNIGTPYLYEDHISKGEFIEPEPYNHYMYYKDDKHLATVFNYLLNNKDEFIQPFIDLTETEQIEAKQFIEQMKKENDNKPIIFIQPWASSGGYLAEENKVKPDETFRSIQFEFGKRLTSKLIEKGYLPFIIKAGNQVGFEGCKTFNNLPIRKQIALIPYIDGVICVDSFMHHAVAALGNPVKTVVLWGGTNPKNLSYKDQHNILPWKTPLYEPNRVPHDHAYYVTKNKGVNDFKLEIINEIMGVFENGGNNKKDLDKRTSVEEHSESKE